MEKEELADKIRFLLVTDESSSASTDRLYRVTPVLIYGLYVYWVSFVLEFRFAEEQNKGRDKVVFEHASLSFFRGEASDLEKVALLRAEWGDLERYATHAQPHWHLYPEGRDGFELSRNLFLRDLLRTQAASAVEVEEFGGGEAIPEFGTASEPASIKKAQHRSSSEEEEVNLTKMHFAMAAEWHQDRQGNERIAVDEKGLQRWSGRCLLYVISQIEYAFGR